MIEGGVSALQDLSRYMPDIAKAATASATARKAGRRRLWPLATN